LYIFAVQIVLNQSFAIAFRITIPVAVNTYHRVIRKFDADA
jgi:hypothetical protein